jgi:hypothetical protein
VLIENIKQHNFNYKANVEVKRDLKISIHLYLNLNTVVGVPQTTTRNIDVFIESVHEQTWKWSCVY